MPKVKPHRGASKRFRKTGTGKIVRKQAGVSHYLENKRASRRRRLQRLSTVSPADTRRVRKMLGS